MRSSIPQPLKVRFTPQSIHRFGDLPVGTVFCIMAQAQHPPAIRCYQMKLHGDKSLDFVHYTVLASHKRRKPCRDHAPALDDKVIVRDAVLVIR